MKRRSSRYIILQSPLYRLIPIASRPMCSRWILLAFLTITSNSVFGQNESIENSARTRGVIVEAEDTTQCRVEGKSHSVIYPRSVGRKCVILSEGATLTATGVGRAVYLRLPTVFASPGPRYGDFIAASLRVRIDGGEWQTVMMATARQEWPVAENLPDGKHQVEVQAVDGSPAVDGFRFADRPLNAVLGSIFTAGYSELLTDVRVDLIDESNRMRTEYVRSPLTGTFEIWGLAPGSYRVVVTAAGWLPVEVKNVVVRGEPLDEKGKSTGQRLDLGTLILKRDPRCGGVNLQEIHGPRFGQSVSVKPGDSFVAPINFLEGTTLTTRLVSRYRTIDLPITESRRLNYGRWNHIGVATLKVPLGTPHDCYDLVATLTQPTDSNKAVATMLAQAVCVREDLPERFFVAGCGHMNTWGQQTAEYLERVAEVAELAGARLLLISNEVNAAYVSGALKSVRIPYLATRGNHSQPRWEEFYGATSTTFDDGPLRAVTFGRWPYESWHDAERHLSERPQATNRIVLCYEGYAPIRLIRDSQIDLLFDAHSDDPHPDAADFPPGMIKVRAPTQETIRWIPMTANGVAPEVRQPADLPVLNIPRSGPAPLRVSYQLPNDGSATEQTVVVKNEYPQAFPQARLRLAMRSGRYKVEGGTVLQSFDDDTGNITVLDLQLELKPQDNQQVTVKPQS